MKREPFNNREEIWIMTILIGILFVPLGIMLILRYFGAVK